MHIDILDTAGQEEYATMRDNYYRSGEGFFCVYAIDSFQSFSLVKEFHAQILRVTEQDAVPFLLVGNKSDIVDSREVDKSAAENLASEINCNFYETSAKTNYNVEVAFLDLVKQVKLAKEELCSLNKDKKTRCVLQ